MFSKQTSIAQARRLEQDTRCARTIFGRQNVGLQGELGKVDVHGGLATALAATALAAAAVADKETASTRDRLPCTVAMIVQHFT